MSSGHNNHDHHAHTEVKQDYAPTEGHHDYAHHNHGVADSFTSNVTELIANATSTVLNATIEAVTQIQTTKPIHIHDHQDHIEHETIIDHSGHSDADHSAHVGHQMRMWFHGGYDEVILFDFWRINSFSGLFISCIIIFIIGALYEGLKWYRMYRVFGLKVVGLFNNTLYVQTNSNNVPVKDGVTVSLRFSNNEQILEQALIKSPDVATTDDVVYAPTTVQAPNGSASPKGIRSFITEAVRRNEKTITSHRVFQSSLYCVQLTLAYWLMLIAMTYNIWLTGAVILGAGFGHWLFAALKCVNANTSQQEAISGDACH